MQLGLIQENQQLIQFHLISQWEKILLHLGDEAKKVQRSLNYKFVWTWQGQVFVRKQDNSRTIKISILRDLHKLECPPMGNWFSRPNH